MKIEIGLGIGFRIKRIEKIVMKRKMREKIWDIRIDRKLGGKKRRKEVKKIKKRIRIDKESEIGGGKKKKNERKVDEK